MSEIITKGVTYSLEDLPESIRKEDLEYMIARGNHNSATSKDNADSLLKIVKRKYNVGGCYLSLLNMLQKLKTQGLFQLELLHSLQ